MPILLLKSDELASRALIEVNFNGALSTCNRRYLSCYREMKKLLGLPNVCLLLALVALALSHPFLEHLQSEKCAVITFYWAILVLVPQSEKSAGAETRIGYALLIPTFILHATAALTGACWIYVTAMLFQAALHAFVVVCFFRYVLRDDIMRLDELFAAGSLYAMLAFIFAYLYSMIEHILLGAFFINENNNSYALFSWLKMLYLSLTCLTSVELGEITPVSDHARSFVMIQQLVGVLYLAIVISRLISMQSRRTK